MAKVHYKLLYGMGCKYSAMGSQSATTTIKLSEVTCRRCLRVNSRRFSLRTYRNVTRVLRLADLERKERGNRIWWLSPHYALVCTKHYGRIVWGLSRRRLDLTGSMTILDRTSAAVVLSGLLKRDERIVGRSKNGER